jgi:hypothetical protein
VDVVASGFTLGPLDGFDEQHGRLLPGRTEGSSRDLVQVLGGGIGEENTKALHIPDGTS